MTSFARKARAVALRNAASIGLAIAIIAAAVPTNAADRIGPDKKTGAITYPILINRNGNYELGADLDVPAGLDGIVLAPGVTAVIDLAGRTISGAAQCSYWFSQNCYSGSGTVGIRVPEKSVLQVSNGTVRGFNRAGIGGVTFNNATVIANNIRVVNNGRGIQAYDVMAENIIADDNVGTAISAESGSVINSVATRNGQGIHVSMGTVRGCVARANGGYGFMFQRTSHQDNQTFDNGNDGGSYSNNGATNTVNSPFSPGVNNNYND